VVHLALCWVVHSVVCNGVMSQWQRLWSIYSRASAACAQSNSMSTPICCRWRAEWMDVNWSWVWLLLLLRMGCVGGALPSLGDAIQRRVNSIAGDRYDSNPSLVRREFGRRGGTCQVHSTIQYIHWVSLVAAGSRSGSMTSMLNTTLLRQTVDVTLKVSSQFPAH